MGSITLANARFLQSDQVRARRIWDTTPQFFSMFAALPWLPVQGEALVVNRAKKDKDTITDLETRGKGVMMAEISANPGTDLEGTEAQAAYDPVDPAATFYIREFVGDVGISNFTSRALSGQNPQREFQLDAKYTSMEYAFAAEFITGDGTTAADDRITGIDQMVDDLDASQTVATPGSGNRPLTRGIDQLLGAIHDNDGEATFLLMSVAGLLALKDAVRAQGNVLLPQRDERTGKVHLSYDRVTIFVNSFIPTNLGTTTVYAGVLGEECGLYAIYPDGVGDRGLVQEEVLQHPTVDYSVTRLHWYCGLATHGGRSVAKLTGFPIATGS